MFTGIVQEIGTIAAVPEGGLVIGGGPVLAGLELGASVAVNGVCLTVTRFDARTFTVDVVPETLRRTNLGRLRPGSRVNLERALTLNRELGGHLVQGHIDDTGTLAAKMPEGPSVRMRFTAPPSVLRFVVPKGFIAIDGTSLTVAEKAADSFTVAVIPATLSNTVLAERKVGDPVNLEADIIGKYVAEFVQPKSTGVTAEFLRQNGFPVD